MSCAIDTNIIVELLSGDAEIASRAASVLEQEGRSGSLCISPFVYAECLGRAGSRERDLDAVLRDTHIAVAWELPKTVWVRAAAAFAQYAERRRKERQMPPRRILADFIIGAHAVDVGGLITRDDFYKRYFPTLRLVRP